MSKNAFIAAIEVAGGQKALAKQIGRNPSVVWSWLHVSKKGVSAEGAVAIERATGVPRWLLRPDLFDRPGPTPPASS